MSDIRTRPGAAVVAKQSLAAALALSCAALPFNAAAQSGPTPVPCVGTWRTVSDYVDGRSGGQYRRMRGGRDEGNVTVEVDDCGRVIRVTQGRTMELERTSVDPVTYEAELDAGGVHRTFRFVLNDPQSMSGEVVAQDPRLRVDRPTHLEFVGGAQPEDIGCGEAPERVEIDSELRDEVLTIVARLVGVPREEASRYIHIPTHIARTRMNDGGPDATWRSVEANMLLDASGRLLPVTSEGSRSGRIRVDQPGSSVCSTAEDELPEAVRMLRLTFRSPPGAGRNIVQAHVLDAETRIIETSYHAEEDRAGFDARAAAAIEAYDGVDEPVTGVHPDSQ
ncbi:hypothetical protein DDZ18_04910 [Marinicauda salina]|uniref:DUF3617 family protein n=1 Tax=Marinicauda salina TaxID=2135793 RepID=A0A2U2BV98_9PROT|nr:hypothetical protein [Marinicauda salina]PWE17917.1 hypothetical protein DDZ18_04910 [Marinicauda salina]